METQSRAVPPASAAPDGSVCFLPVSELAARIRARRLRPTDLVAGSLDRLERLGPRYNAVATLMRQSAMDEAIDQKTVVSLPPAADAEVVVTRGGLRPRVGV